MLGRRFDVGSVEIEKFLLFWGSGETWNWMPVGHCIGKAGDYCRIVSQKLRGISFWLFVAVTFLSHKILLGNSKKSEKKYQEEGPIYRTRTICEALRDLVPFVQFKKREKPWRSVIFSEVAGFSKCTNLIRLWINCTNGTKSRKEPHINPFHATVSFYTPWKYQNTKGFLMFPGGIERDQWH